jgi:peroxiredoxin Q/BCP
MRRIPYAFFLFLFVFLASDSRAQESDAQQKLPPQRPPTNVSAPVGRSGADLAIESTVYVGDHAPGFELDGSQGQRVRLTDLKGQWAVMVFEASRSRIGSLKPIDGDLRKLGARLYGVTKDGSSALKTYAERQGLPFVLLSDPTGQISQVFGMYDHAHDSIQPGMILLDPEGVVRMTFIGPSLHGADVLQLVKHTVIGG